MFNEMHSSLKKISAADAQKGHGPIGHGYQRNKTHNEVMAEKLLAAITEALEKQLGGVVPPDGEDSHPPFSAPMDQSAGMEMAGNEVLRFKPGDVVILKSGGPAMTIQGIASRSHPTMVLTTWFDNELHQVDGSFPSCCLSSVPLVPRSCESPM